MKINLYNKIGALIIMFVFLIISLSPAQIANQQLIDTGSFREVIVSEKLDYNYYGKGYVESMEDSISRDILMRSKMDENINGIGTQHGIWVVPSIEATFYPCSGNHYVTNKWGDTMMGISFPNNVDVNGAWFAGQGGGEGVWTKSIRVIGYRNGKQSQSTDWFEDIDDTPSWFEINLLDVDRMVIEATPTLNGGGWYAMDDLTYTYKIGTKQEHFETMVLDFEDCSYTQNLNSLNYAGLTWETGTGDFYTTRNEMSESKTFERGKYSSDSYDNLAIESSQVCSFQGVIRGDAGSWSYPPDSCGAAGPDHFVEVVNRNFAVYDKYTGEELINILLGSFLPGSNGDPRVLYDQYSDRWFVIVCDFDTKIFLAVSTSDDPTDSWFKCDFVVSQDEDAGKWPDYPTLGVDEVGIYTAAYMIGGSNGMSIFALDKTPLIASEPSLGDIYAFRELPWEGAIQPVHTFGETEGEYFVSRMSSTAIRVRLLTDLLTNPTLTELGYATIPSHSEPPDAPALGSTIPLDTVGHRLMNAVYRDGHIWTAHCINVNGRAASRWYKISVPDPTLADYGTICDPVMYYFFPSIMVNAGGNVVMGFSGSHSGQYAAAYYTGRTADDPPGEMNPPSLLKEGEDTYNLIDGYGRNRWGDYSLCSLDPSNEFSLWTIQEYAHSHNYSGENRWGTWIGELIYGNQPPNKPVIDGPTNGTTGVSYDFIINSEDPEGEDVYFFVDWGDGTPGEWIGPYSSGQDINVSHTWEEVGEYEILAKSKDKYFESTWSDSIFLNIKPLIEIQSLKGGFFKVKAVLKNNADKEITCVKWNITLDGGAFIGKKSSGQVDIPGNGEVTINSKIILGFGKTKIKVTAFVPECSDELSKGGFVYLIYVHVNIGGGSTLRGF